MTGIPHPHSMIQYASDRRAEMLAQARQEQLVNQARSNAVQPRVTGFAVTVAVLLVAALLVGVSALLIVDPDQPALLGLVREADATAPQIAETQLLDPMAVADTAATRL